MSKLEEAVAKLRFDLEWRGPSGKPAKFVCLDRELAQALLQQVERPPPLSDFERTNFE